MHKIDLSGPWTLVCEGEGGEHPVQVPGDNVSALLAAGVIADPYQGMNELDVQWIGRENWVFKRIVEIDADFLAAEGAFLSFESLDTVAEIFLNGTCVGRSDNMFLRWRKEVKDALIVGENELAIRFLSPEKEAKARHDRMPYPIPSGGAPVMSPHRNMLRKVQCHAGWDWGVCLMVSGIYGAACLEAVDGAMIDHTYTKQTFHEGGCELEVTVEATALRETSAALVVSIDGRCVETTVALKPGTNLATATVEIENPQLWWPNGYGDQPLYPLTVKLGDCEIRKRIGLRNVELATCEDEHGLSFVLRVNEVDVFCKGANWIPVDALPARHTRAVYDRLLGAAVAANMNMVRVWGGGQYERDAFYELCDEKGIMVWHDFMFACALYPATPEFLASVAGEVAYQVKRLRDCAAIVLWCGNNENLGALNWFKESREQRDRYLVDYDRLNEGVVGRLVDELDPTRSFWPSSPCGGRGDYSDCFHDDTRGDMHFWSVWHEGKSFDAFHQVSPRFCSEFGYQSFPSLPTIRTYAEEKDFNVTSPVMEHHQRNSGGNSKIIEMFSRYFRMPNGFDQFVYLSQVQQAAAMQTAVEYWRHLRPVCMGALYWQLNDNWPVCSWASLEYGGTWKLLHYAAKRFFAPVHCLAFQKDGQVEVWVVNDRLVDVEAEVALAVFDFAGGELQAGLRRQVVATRESAVQVVARPASDFVDAPSQGFLHVEMTTDEETRSGVHFFTEWKRCELAASQIAVDAIDNDGVFEVRLSASAPAFFVAVESHGVAGVFDDNLITLLPGRERTLRFTPSAPCEVSRFKKALAVYHLANTY